MTTPPPTPVDDHHVAPRKYPSNPCDLHLCDDTTGSPRPTTFRCTSSSSSRRPRVHRTSIGPVINGSNFLSVYTSRFYTRDRRSCSIYTLRTHTHVYPRNRYIRVYVETSFAFFFSFFSPRAYSLLYFRLFARTSGRPTVKNRGTQIIIIILLLLIHRVPAYRTFLDFFYTREPITFLHIFFFLSPLFPLFRVFVLHKRRYIIVRASL